jgi:hypothetical protein
MADREQREKQSSFDTVSNVGNVSVPVVTYPRIR